jgi:hypothetical protein
MNIILLYEVIPLLKIKNGSHIREVNRDCNMKFLKDIN